MIGATASAGQAVEKLKVLLENAESEWANEPAAVRLPGGSLNHRPDRISKPVNHRCGFRRDFGWTAQTSLRRTPNSYCLGAVSRG